MTEWNPLYLSHIGRVKANYVLSSTDLDPDEVTRQLFLQPDFFCRRGDPRRNTKGEPIGDQEKEGLWGISSQGLDSKDLNAHIELLLSRLLPHEAMIRELIEVAAAKSYFDVLWESSYLYAGTGPILEEGVIDGMSRLRASIGFDIYQIDGEDDK